MKIYYLLILMLLQLNLFSQRDNEIIKLVDTYIENVKKGNYVVSPNNEFFKSENADIVINHIQNYCTDTLEKVRLNAYYIMYKSAYNSNNSVLRQLAVYNLVQGLKDKSAGNVGNIAEWLTYFYSDDYNDIAKDSLSSVLHMFRPHNDKIIRIIGFVGLNNEANFLKESVIQNKEISKKQKWSAHIALARMGDVNEVQYSLDIAKKIPLNDDSVYELIPDLIYIKQKPIYDYILTILFSNEKKCTSSNPENPVEIECGYRIMEYLASVINEFPIEVDSMGGLITDDYSEALNITRDWFSDRKGDYKIKIDSY